MKLLRIYFLLGLIYLPFLGEAAQPDWQIRVTDFQYTATVTGVIELDREPIGNPSDRLAAFVNGELRGVSQPIFIVSLQRYYIFITVASNSVSGETISFKYYQAETDQIIDLYDSFEFINDSVIGSIDEPVVFSNINEEIPTVRAKNITVMLGETGQVSIYPSDIDNGTEDNGSFTLSLDRNTFTCSELGTQQVTLTALDESGNQSSVQATVTVMDQEAPVVQSQPITRHLNVNDQLVVSPEEFDGGSYDNCSFTLSLDRNSFTAVDLGEQSLILTATDQSGNRSSKEVNLTILPYNYPPEVITEPFSLKENSKNDFQIGKIEAKDKEGQELTFSIDGGNEEETFRIDAVTGKLFVNDNELLDYELYPTFTLLIAVTDGIDVTKVEIEIILQDVKEKTDFEVYPNPAVSTICLKMDKDNEIDILSVTAFASDGSTAELELINNGLGKQVYSIKNLKAGIYYILIVTTEGTYSTRLIKISHSF